MRNRIYAVTVASAIAALCAVELSVRTTTASAQSLFETLFGAKPSANQIRKRPPAQQRPKARQSNGISRFGIRLQRRRDPYALDLGLNEGNYGGDDRSRRRSSKQNPFGRYRVMCVRRLSLIHI